MENFKHVSTIKDDFSRPHRISISSDGTFLLMLNYNKLLYYQKIDGVYQQILKQEMKYTRWEVHSFQLHCNGNRFAIIYLHINYLFYFQSYILCKKTMLWKLYHQYYLFENKFSNRNILQFFISQDLDYVNTPYNEEMLEDTMGAYQFSSLFSPKLIRCQQFQGNKLKYIKKKNLILAMYSKKVLLYDYNQYLKKHEINVGCQVLDITSDSYRIIYIYCTRSLIKWDLNQFKKKQEYIIEPIYQYLHYQVQLYYLQDTMIFFNKDHEIYYLDLKKNDSCQIKKHPKTEYEKFLSSEEGNMFLLFTYSKNKSYNYFRVFTYQN